MKKSIIFLLIIIVITSFFVGCTVSAELEEKNTTEVAAETTGFGAAGAKDKENLSVKEMIKYTIEDEYLARQEYELIMDEFGQQRPFSNIIKAEEYHIELLEEIYETYGYEVPENVSKNYVILPESIQHAFETGVVAEINNIAMYEKFLEEDLPEDIRETFEELRDASKNHLRAFERRSTRNGNGHGNGKG